MRYSLLEMTQRILGSMESDEVSSIGETPEARDVVAIIKECYFDILGQGSFAEQEGFFKLDASTDDTKPVLMLVPDNVIRIDFLKYNYETLLYPEYKEIHYLSPPRFIERFSGMEGDEVSSMTLDVDGTNYVFKYRNDRIPTYYTILKDRYVVFDSFDETIETTLTQVRSLGGGLMTPEFLEEDDFIPELDPRQFQLLLQDAKSTAHIELKQQPNQKAEQKYRRNWIYSQKTKHDSDPSSSRQSRREFGRRGRW